MNSPSTGRLLARIVAPSASSNASRARRKMLDARQGAEHQRSAKRGNGAAPVALDPVAGNPQAQQYQHAAEQRPARGHPSLQHPQHGRAHRRSAEEHADPRVAEQLADGQTAPCAGGYLDMYVGC